MELGLAFKYDYTPFDFDSDRFFSERSTARDGRRRSTRALMDVKHLLDTIKSLTSACLLSLSLSSSSLLVESTAAAASSHVHDAQ